MARLPILSGKAVVKALAKAGCSETRRRGSHIRLVCPGKPSITVPNHRVVGRGLLKKILRDAELSVKQFAKLL